MMQVASCPKNSRCPDCQTRLVAMLASGYAGATGTGHVGLLLA
jgi:hypothetical protein